MEDYRQRLQTSFIVLSVTLRSVLLSLHIKRASATGTFCNLAMICGFLLQTSCRRRIWKGNKALEIWMFLCFKCVLVQPLLVNPAMINELPCQLLKVICFFRSLGLTFLSPSNSKPPKYATSSTTKISLKWNPRLVDTKIESDFFNGKRVAENLS